MEKTNHHKITRAQESSNAIERLYITMRHLFNRGFYKPMGVSGETLRESLLSLRPEIYGSVAEEKVELNGLHYVIDRLPLGIEECSQINLTSEEGHSQSHFEVIVPLKRRRNCYRIDAEQMNIEITRGRSDIYDILTHLTFLFLESSKIMRNALVNDNGEVTYDWVKLERAVKSGKKLTLKEREVAITHVASILGRTFKQVLNSYDKFANVKNPDRLLSIVYWLGKLAMNEELDGNKRIVNFSPVLRERIGHHIHGERWANTIKETLQRYNLLHRPIHIISANMHSVMNTLFVPIALKEELAENDLMTIFELLSDQKNKDLRNKVTKVALDNGMIYLKDHSGTNIDVQIFDLKKVGNNGNDAVVVVMDYAFGEQAYETIDELLKPYNIKEKEVLLNIESISIMGKAGILEGGKGDIMIPSAHVFEGTADNYPFENELKCTDFKGEEMNVVEGTMVTVLGTSLQNKDILKFFKESTWKVIGIEMEGAHYHKAIQSASKVRKSITENVKVRYAYYASDNPLETGSTLASGGLGTTGVRPTYIITRKILEQIIN